MRRGGLGHGGWRIGHRKQKKEMNVSKYEQAYANLGAEAIEIQLSIHDRGRP